MTLEKQSKEGKKKGKKEERKCNVYGKNVSVLVQLQILLILLFCFARLYCCSKVKRDSKFVIFL
jgi:hypothetical protein